MSQAKVFADFHNADERGRVRLNCAGTLQDLSGQNVRLVPGLAVTLYSEDVEAEGVVEYSTEENLWVAAVDWTAILGEPAPGSNGVAHHGQVPVS